ncbi:SdpI family protein [Chengkuizengella axinellae]|uniref:SdpI family protein n=1 Tax=Chengkuizengella axinellae TaxID=3064388 RepID=A0ABT9J5V8_9BACL|nr:SdpI family protein [Chengkuizengella sp. 2205SS18-9]MDP5277002.1 SdpI family protein [Chengkuizengella sp. 2205SS18-9]
MKNKKWSWIDLVLLIIAAIPIFAAILVYDQLPEQLATHFNVYGEPDSFTSKFAFIIIFSIVVILVPFLVKLSKYIDPKRANYIKFERAFEITRIAITVLLSGVYGIMILYNLGYNIDIIMVVYILVGLNFIILGNYMGQFRHNYFIGVRLPWTLSNEEVWRKTHRLAGPVMMISGILLLVCIFLPEFIALWILVIIVLSSVMIPTIYSYVLHQRLENNK